jgi:16S rRNA (uracil1498-N3)-methyltransferase
MRRFYAPVEQFEDSSVKLSTEETRHLRDVLRLSTGDRVQIFNGEGREFVAEITSVGKRETLLRIVDEISAPAPESNLDLTIAASVYKNDKFDLVIQKAVELGVARISPIVTFRSESKIDAALNRIDRWRKIALEATKQCERARIMTIDEPMPFEDFLSSLENESGDLLIFSEKDGRAIPDLSHPKKITALVGPKGGWEDSEIELAEARGFVPVKLGKRIMKAETAVITFAALLQHRFGDLV